LEQDFGYLLLGASMIEVQFVWFNICDAGVVAFTLRWWPLIVYKQASTIALANLMSLCSASCTLCGPLDTAITHASQK